MSAKWEFPEGIELLDAVKEMVKVQLKQPVVSRLRVSHSVPFGRWYRQWNTRGELEVWVNRGWLMEAVPKKPPALGGSVLSTRLTGIPVVFEDHPDEEEKDGRA